MGREPIPDAVLRQMADSGAGGSWPSEAKDVARDLLALRGAARRVAGWGNTATSNMCRCGWLMGAYSGPKEAIEAWSSHAKECQIEALLALLPEEPA